MSAHELRSHIAPASFRAPIERMAREIPDPPPEPVRDIVLAERLRAEALELDRFAPTAARLHRMAADRADPPRPSEVAPSTSARDKPDGGR